MGAKKKKQTASRGLRSQCRSNTWLLVTNECRQTRYVDLETTAADVIIRSDDLQMKMNSG